MHGSGAICLSIYQFLLFGKTISPTVPKSPDTPVTHDLLNQSGCRKNSSKHNCIELDRKLASPFIARAVLLLIDLLIGSSCYCTSNQPCAGASN